MGNKPVDVCIVGAGASGGVLATELAEGGFSVVVLEAGQHWAPQHDWSSDELATENQSWRESRITAGRNPLKLAKNNSGRGVGGGTVHFNGVALRLREDDLRMQSADGVGVDWPWPPVHPPYPYPARNPLSGPAMLFQQGCAKLGIRSVPAPLFILSAPFDGRPACINRGFCVQGCMVNAKFSTLITYIPRAQRAGAEVRPGCMVTRIETGPDGRVRGVTYLKDGAEHRQEAWLVVLAALSIETPRLLLLSAGPGFEHGLANGSGMVGKRLMTHLSQDVHARFDQKTRPYKGTPVLASGATT